MIDLGPTLLDLAGLSPLAGVQGKSLRPLLSGEDTALRDIVFAEHGQRVMARTMQWYGQTRMRRG